MELYLNEASQSSSDTERMNYVDSRIIELAQKDSVLQKKIDTVQENLDSAEEGLKQFYKENF